METRTEKKYILDAALANLALAVISAHCLPDPDFARVLWDRVFLDTELGVERLPMR